MTFKNTSGNAEGTLININGLLISVLTTELETYEYLVKLWGKPNKFHLVDENTIDSCTWEFNLMLILL